MSSQLSRRLAALPPMSWWRARKRARQADVYVLSYPKVGRTWLRAMLSHLLASHYGEPGLLSDDFGEKNARRYRGAPRIVFKHDGNPHRHTPAEIGADKGEFARTRVILVVRDPRDTTVSNFFQVTRREDTFQGDMATWLAAPRGSIASMLRYYTVWAAQRHVPRDFLLVRYEDMKADAAHELRRIAQFIGLPGVTESAIDAAVDYASFNRMREREAARPAERSRYTAGKQGDPESFKTRRGKIGGYADYLSEEQVAALNARIDRELDPFYGYGSKSAQASRSS